MIEYTNDEDFKRGFLMNPLDTAVMLHRHAAASLGVGLESIQRMVAEGQLVEIKWGNMVGIRYREVVDIEKRQRIRKP